jgi:hypothetical protein
VQADFISHPFTKAEKSTASVRERMGHPIFFVVDGKTKGGPPGPYMSWAPTKESMWRLRSGSPSALAYGVRK